MNYIPLIIVYVGYKITIDKTSRTAIKFYRNELDNLPVNYLLLQIFHPHLYFSSIQEATTSSAQYLVEDRWWCLPFDGKLRSLRSE